MADTVDTNVMIDGPRNYIARFTNVSDSTGESAAVKVDISTLLGPEPGQAPTSLSLLSATWNVQGFEGVKIEWDHTANDEIIICSGEGYVDFRRFGGIHDPRSAGGTGNIVFTTFGTAVANDTYDILLEFVKKE